MYAPAMGIALDYTFRIDPAALRAAGVSDVLRYLKPDRVPAYRIAAAEYRELLAAGIGVTLNWEYDAHDWLGGAAAGTAHAALAVAQARALGYPSGCVIVGSADFDMTRTQWTGAARAYARAFKAGVQLSLYGFGVYGPADVLTWCRDEVPADMYWQAGMSISWSGGRNAVPWTGAHLRQRRHLSVAGQDTDLNDILIAHWGQARGAAYEEEDGMGASFGPVQIMVDTPTALAIPPVQAGLADPRRTWLNIGADTYGKPYALRIWASNGAASPAWKGVGTPDGMHVINSGEVYSIELEAGVRLLSISRQPIKDGKVLTWEEAKDQGVTPFDGSISACFERA